MRSCTRPAGFRGSINVDLGPAVNLDEALLPVVFVGASVVAAADPLGFALFVPAAAEVAAVEAAAVEAAALLVGEAVADADADAVPDDFAV